jgi:predicted DNA-binding protein
MGSSITTNTSIRFPNDLLRDLNAAAADSGKTRTALVCEFVRDGLACRQLWLALDNGVTINFTPDDQPGQVEAVK